MAYLRQNLEALRTRAPALAAALDESPGGALTIAVSQEGAPSATVNGHWIHSAYDPRREAQAWAQRQLQAWKAGEVGVVFGVGLLYHVEALMAAKPPDTKVAVIVPDLSMLKDAATVRPLGAWFNTIEWVFGSAQGMAQQLADMAAPLRLLTFEPAARLHAEVHQQLEQQLRSAVASQRGGHLHVALVGPIYGGSLPIGRYAARALEALGHRVTYIDHGCHRQSYDVLGRFREPRHRLLMQSRFADVLSMDTMTQIAEDPPDVVLAIAQAPLNAAVLEHLRSKKFLTAMWFVENYRHLTYWQQLAGAYDYWFVIQRGPCLEALTRAGAQHVSYLPMAADPAVHRPLALSSTDEQEYGADVSFVGAGYPNRRRLLPQWLSNDWSFKLWGNEWEGAADLQSVLQRQGARVDTETCVKIFNATAVNLNLHSCAGESLDAEPDFVNPRTFELASCGAFQLVDRRTPLPDLFRQDEMVCFSRPEETPRLIRAWLADAPGRRATAEAAKRRVAAEHTYEHRMTELLSTLGVRQPDRIGAVLRGDRSAGSLAARTDCAPELAAVLNGFPPHQRVELKEVAERIRAKGPRQQLSREDLLVLLLDSYRAETRDLV